jgi:hypothetical protein
MAKYFLYLIFAMMLLAYAGCKTGKDSAAVQNDSSHEESAMAITGLSIEYSEGAFSYALNGFRIVATEKNVKPSEPISLYPNDFLGFLMNENKVILDTIHISRPLHPRYELYDEDGNISSVTIAIPATEVLLRFPWSKRIKFLGISHFDDQNRLSEPVLIPFPVNP